MKLRSLWGSPVLFALLFACGDRVALDLQPNRGDIGGMVPGPTGGTGDGEVGGTRPPPTGGTGEGNVGGTDPRPTGGTGGGVVGGTGPRPTGGTGGGGISVEPGFIDFGLVALGSQISRSFTIRNTGSAPVAQLDLLFGADANQFSITSNCVLPLAPAASCTVTVWFTPIPGMVKTKLTVSSSAGSFVVNLSGSGGGTPGIALSPSSHAFGNVDLDAASLPSQKFTVFATTGTPGTYTGALSLTIPAGFKVGKDTCTGQSLSRNGSSCTFIVLSDGRPGDYRSTLRVTSAMGGQALVPLIMYAFGGTATGMIGHWQFDEGFGTVVKDSSVNANHGTVRQGSTSSAELHPAPVWERGKKGGALRIDGLDDWVNVPDSDSIDNTGINNQVSISAWIKLDRYNSLKPYNVVAQRHMLGTRVKQFFMGLNNGVPAVGINFFYGIGTTNVPLNEWVHMAMTYDGIQQCGYMNGVVSVCQDVGWPIATDDTPFTMGAGIAEEDVLEQMVGLIDEVRLYDIQLSSAEIAGMYMAP